MRNDDSINVYFDNINQKLWEHIRNHRFSDNCLLEINGQKYDIYTAIILNKTGKLEDDDVSSAYKTVVKNLINGDNSPLTQGEGEFLTSNSSMLNLHKINTLTLRDPLNRFEKSLSQWYLPLAFAKIYLLNHEGYSDSYLKHNSFPYHGYALKLVMLPVVLSLRAIIHVYQRAKLATSIELRSLLSIVRGTRRLPLPLSFIKIQRLFLRGYGKNYLKDNSFPFHGLLLKVVMLPSVIIARNTIAVLRRVIKAITSKNTRKPYSPVNKPKPTESKKIIGADPLSRPPKQSKPKSKQSEQSKSKSKSNQP